jgi:NADH-quinone oxidoreductase subunit N
MTSEPILSSLSVSTPELILAIGALALLMIGVYGGEKSARPVTWLSIVLMVVAALWIIFFPADGAAYSGAFVSDHFSRFMKILALIGSASALLMSSSLQGVEKIDKFEFPVLVTLATLGMMLMISAHDLISFYMSLELQSLALYVVAAMNRESARSTEAGLKYFVLGALSSGMMLYGMSLVYGFTGHTNFAEIAKILGAETRSLGLVFGLVFVLAGVAFKISAAPFHMWTPDVYEGAPTPVTAFFAGAPKIAAMAVFVRVVIEAFQPITHDWQQIVAFVSLLSMVIGSFAAIGQTSFKRLMAYSSIGHMGYALVGLAAGNQTGVSGVMLYMTIYVAMTLGTFAIIMSMRNKDGEALERIDDFAGLSTTDPLMAAVLTIMMFSLAGIPPLAGFFAKYFVFVAAIKAGLYWLSVIGVLASVVGCYYYLRVVKLMWFDAPVREIARVPGSLKFVYSLAGIFVIGYVVFGGPIGNAAEAAAAALF